MKLRANGKLLLTGEYAVLDGATALALPTKLGQLFELKNARGSDIKWKSLDQDGNEWFSCVLSLYDFSAVKTTNEHVSDILQKILNEATRLNSDFLSSWKGISIQSKLEFDKEWGLGSSATLIYFISQWAQVDPYTLLDRTIGGSGYDIACCDTTQPIFYSKDNGTRHIEEAPFNPAFKEQLYFVHLNQKQSTAAEIKEYTKRPKSDKHLIDELNDLTHKISKVKRFSHFEKLISHHEDLLSKHLDKEPIGKQAFTGYWGKIKSLGAWGGDFVLATSDRSEDDTISYFQNKGYKTVLRYTDIILD